MAVKICQLCAVDFTVEKFLTPLIDGMKNEGWDVTTVCSNGPLVKKLKDNGYKIKTIPISRSFNLIKALISIIKLSNYFRKEQFDIIHVHTPVASLLARIAAKISCSSFIVYTAHGFYFHDEMPFYKKYFFIKLERFVGKFTNLLFCQSSEDAISAVKYRIMDNINTVTIGNGVDISKFNFKKYKSNNLEIKKSINLPENSIVIGIIARKVKEKGYIEFLEAAISLNKLKKNIYFILIGGKLKSDHDAGIDVFLQNAKKELASRLIDLDFRNDIPELISVMDVFCLPSYREGLPRTIIEAMFLKKPVIATNIRGCREQVIDGISGFLIPIKDSKALHDAILKIILDEKLKTKMGENGYKIAMSKFDEKVVINTQINSIKERLKI